jgi:hypothetical protein
MSPPVTPPATASEYDEKAGKTEERIRRDGVGCEAWARPRRQHARSTKKKDIFNQANVDFQARSRVCGYCHIRLENEKWSAQGNPARFPAPKVGETYIAGDDWTKWYPQR